MDKEKLGRALGYAARHGARSLRDVTEAAVAPDPRAQRAAAVPAQQVPAQQVPAQQVPAAPRVLPGKARAAGRSVWKPLAKFSSVLWLEVTGFFFAVFAVAMGHAAWVDRVAAAGTPQRTHLLTYAALTAFFIYFAGSSFLRARRRERR